MKALPRFSVGEVVILQSPNRPEFNGEDTVLEVLYSGDASMDRVVGCLLKYDFASPIAYKLQNSIPQQNDYEGNKCEGIWRESSLRKKQEPGEMSFMQLMSSLKIEENV